LIERTNTSKKLILILEELDKAIETYDKQAAVQTYKRQEKVITLEPWGIKCGVTVEEAFNYIWTPNPEDFEELNFGKKKNICNWMNEDKYELDRQI
jgi:hypothetical protein